MCEGSMSGVWSFESQNVPGVVVRTLGRKEERARHAKMRTGSS